MGTHGAGEREDLAEASCAVGDEPAEDERSPRVLGRLRRRFDELLVRMLGDEMDRLDPAAASPFAGLTSATPVAVATAEEGVARWTAVNAPPTSGYRSRHRLVVPEAREGGTVPEARGENSTPPRAPSANTGPVHEARRPARHRSPPRHAAPSARLVVRFTSKETAQPTGTDRAQAAR